MLVNNFVQHSIVCNLLSYYELDNDIEIFTVKLLKHSLFQLGDDVCMMGKTFDIYI